MFIPLAIGGLTLAFVGYQGIRINRFLRLQATMRRRRRQAERFLRAVLRRIERRQRLSQRARRWYRRLRSEGVILRDGPKSYFIA